MGWGLRRWKRLGARHSSLTNQRGVALIEFALVLPMILLLLFGMIDAGKAINYWNDETHLASEAARFAAVNKNPFPGEPDLEHAIKDQADSAELRNGCGGCSIGGGGIKVSFCFVETQGPSDPNPGQPDTRKGHPVRATVTATYNWMAYLVGQGIGAHSGLTATSTMRIEQDYEPSPSNPSDFSGNAYLKSGPVAC
jgi:hypothetical protein